MSENRSETVVRNYDRGYQDGLKAKLSTRVFFVDEVRSLLHQLDREEISLSKFVEVLNEKATGLSAIDLYKNQIKQNECKHEQGLYTGSGDMVCQDCGITIEIKDKNREE